MIESPITGALAIDAPSEGSGSAEPTHTVWHVFTEVGTHVMTLGALEAALQRGDVSLATLVWFPGMAEWEPLGQVASLESASLLADDPQRASGVFVAQHRSGDEAEHLRCAAALATGHAAHASRATDILPASRAQARRERAPLHRASQRRWRRAATLVAALLLILLGGRRLAEAVAQPPVSTEAPTPAHG